MCFHQGRDSEQLTTARDATVQTRYLGILSSTFVTVGTQLRTFPAKAVPQVGH